MLSIAIMAESIGYDSSSVNDHIAFRPSWLDALRPGSHKADYMVKKGQHKREIGYMYI